MNDDDRRKDKSGIVFAGHLNRIEWLHLVEMSYPAKTCIQNQNATQHPSFSDTIHHAQNCPNLE